MGYSYEGKRMYGYLIGLGCDTRNATMVKPAILIDGAHHARELSSISMSVYSVLRLIYGYVKEDPTTLYLLNNAAIVVIPVVNVDGFRAIGNEYLRSGQLEYYRKNMHTYSS